jgi:hypothetical protein
LSLSSNSLTISDGNSVALPIRTLIEDDDADTKIQVEESNDDDIIRFDVEGTEVASLDDKTFHLGASGSSLFVGIDAGINDDGSNNRNTFIGFNAGMTNTTGSNNTFVGQLAGTANVGGLYNTYIGQRAGTSNTAGQENTFIGESSGLSNETGTANVFLDSLSGSSNVGGTSNIFLGYNSGGIETGSNRLYIEPSSSSTPLIYGEFDNDIVKINGMLGIGTPTPNRPLSIQGSAGASSQWISLKDNAGSDKWHLNDYNGLGLNFSESGAADGRLFLEHGGNIGVGTLDPDAKLHVIGNLRMDNGEFQSNGSIVLQPDVDQSGDSHSLIVRDGNGVNRLLISQAGRFGLNTEYSNVSMTVRGIAGDPWFFSIENDAGNPLLDVLGDGNVAVINNLSKGGGSFKIDHPLDPENKYLYHSFVESPDMMNVYNGNVTTDANGFSVVELPDYFLALNKDYRYQLTVIGTFAQAIIKEKVANNKFVIQTNEPNVEVSWQVTGIRQDAYANKNRIPNEVDKKPEEKGFYLHPEAFGQPTSKSLSVQRKKPGNKLK